MMDVMYLRNIVIKLIAIHKFQDTLARIMRKCLLEFSNQKWIKKVFVSERDKRIVIEVRNC
jgi:hypothetical protein